MFGAVQERKPEAGQGKHVDEKHAGNAAKAESADSANEARGFYAGEDQREPEFSPE